MKNKYKYKLYICIIFFALCATRCQQKEKQNFTCIGIEKISSFPLDQWTPAKPVPTMIDPIEISWKIQLDESKLLNPKQIIARGNDQIWILSDDIYLFRKSTNNLKQYSIAWNDSNNTPWSLYLSKEKTLWAYGFTDKTKIPILSYYNENLDRFEPVFDSQDIQLMQKGIRGNIAEDNEGKLWIVLPNIGLFTFDPVNFTTEKIKIGLLSDKDYIESLAGDIAIDKNDGVWLSTDSDEMFNYLIYVNTKKNEASILALNPDFWERDIGLLIDKEDRLWIGDYAFWNVGDQFPEEGYTGINQIIRSPVFVTQHFPFHDYLWLRPRVILEDNEGFIWYSSYGLVRFNPESGEWCKVFDSSTRNISIAQDEKGVFWTVSDGKLFVHE